MMETALEEAKLKQLVKDALIEIIDERPEILGECLRDAVEDIAMIKAIQEGEDSGLVDREAILRLLEEES